MVLRRVVAIAAVAAILVGCADGQGAYASGASGHFRPGVTTRAEAIAELGSPNSVYESADGSHTLTWARAGGLFNAAATRSLSVQFGPDDRMIRIVSDSSAKPG
jgi:hypothetical protein